MIGLLLTVWLALALIVAIVLGLAIHIADEREAQQDKAPVVNRSYVPSEWVA